MKKTTRKQKKWGSRASAAVDRQLERYRKMRDFAATPEPEGGEPGRRATKTRVSKAPRTAGAEALPFVVQKHAATRLHYDFRLGWNGVLKSWAVTKGPSYYPGDKRLAVEVEDHPMEYGGFEGTIPKGEYGGGTVEVWDQGTWVPEGNVDQGLMGGQLKFELKGEKLKGKWVLVLMHGRAGGEKKRNWLLIKERDRYARSADAEAITESAPDSVVTGRTMEQIAAGNDHVWRSSRAKQKSGASRLYRRGRARSPVSAVAEEADEDPARDGARGSGKTSLSALLKGAPREKLPEFIAPQLAQRSGAAADGDQWIHELKLDGYRIQAHIAGRRKGAMRNRVRLFSRNGLDWTDRMPGIAAEAAGLAVEGAILDGEVVVLDSKGRSSFAELQAAFQQGRHPQLMYYVFDLLYLNGRNLRGLPLLKRKEILQSILFTMQGTKAIVFSEHIQGNGERVFSNACKLGAEGIVSKRVDAKYQSGRGDAWQKVKCIRGQELVIGGFTDSSKLGAGLGALLLGYYRGDKLIYAGRSGTGFTEGERKGLWRKLEGLERKTSPFSTVLATGKEAVHWAAPKLVAQVVFATWTRDGLIRQAAFKGLREDKAAREVFREREGEVEKTASKKKDAPPAKRRTRTHPSSGVDGAADYPLTHPEKILDPGTGLTKQELAAYFSTVAGQMLPECGDRPLSIVRCPDGTGKPCFFQKHAERSLPPGVESIAIPNRKEGESENYLTLSSVEGLMGMAQMGAMELHIWGSRNDSLEKPDRMVFDLDPDDSIPWKTLSATAQTLRGLLKKLGLKSFLKSTGGKGLHVVVPLAREHSWSEVKEFAHGVVSHIEENDPATYTTNMTKSARKGKIYLDYLRNDRGATSIAPFSARARPNVPVAMPLNWRELSDKDKPVFLLADLPRWKIRMRRNPWKDIDSISQRLDQKALRKLG